MRRLSSRLLTRSPEGPPAEKLPPEALRRMERFSALVLKLRLPSEVIAGKAHALFQCAGKIVQLVIREISLVGADIIQGLGPGGGVTLVQAFQQTSDLCAALRVRQAVQPIGITDCRAAGVQAGSLRLQVEIPAVSLVLGGQIVGLPGRTVFPVLLLEICA